MSINVRVEIGICLVDIERQMRVLGVWETVAPDPGRLASEVPFCHDTLEFTQWLQWIFIPRFRALLEGDHPLPTACAVAPIAEMAFAEMAGDTDSLLEQLRTVDRLVTGRAAPP